MVQIWDGHRIRKSKEEHVVNGRPLMMYELPELYNTNDYLLPVNQDKLELCETQCHSKNDFPCDQDLFNYCCQIAQAQEWNPPETPEEAINFYINLREHVRRVIL